MSDNIRLQVTLLTERDYTGEDAIEFLLLQEGKDGLWEKGSTTLSLSDLKKALAGIKETV